MESITIWQRLRPTRYAFMVPSGDMEALLQAVSLNTIVWGGIYNPIVPFVPEEECRGLIAEFDPDSIVDLTGGHIPTWLKEEFEHRLIEATDIVVREDHPRKRKRLGLGFGMGVVCRSIYETELHRSPDRSRAAVISEVPEGWGPYAGVTFGTFANAPDLGVDFTADYKTLVGAKDATFEPAADKDYDEWIFPIEVTGHRLRRLGGFAAFSSHVIYVGDHSSFVDLVEFWNIRATGRDVWFLPIAHYTSHQTMVRHMMKAGRYMVNTGYENAADFRRGPGATEEQFKEVLKWAGEFCEGGRLVGRLWRPKFGRQDEGYVGDIRAADLEAARGDDISILIDDRMTPLKLIDPPFLDDDNWSHDYTWSVDLRISNPFTAPEWTCSLPRAKGVGRVVRQVVHAGGMAGPRVGRSGVVVDSDSLGDRVQISPVKTVDLFKRLLEAQTGLEVVQSLPGRYAEQVIRKMGSLQFDCRVFKIRGVREIIDRLSNGSTLTKGNMHDIVTSTEDDKFGTNWREDLYDDMFVRRKKRGADFSSIFDALLEKRVIRPGFTFECSNCAGTDWYHVSEFSEEYTCRYCFERQRVHFGSFRDWQYKSDGLFRIPQSAQGSLAVILALWRLNEAGGRLSGRYTTGMNFRRPDGSVEFELDYSYLEVDTFKTSYELVLGEAKNFMDFAEAKIDALIELSSRFDKRPFLAIATLKDEFSEAEKSLLIDRRRKGHKIIAMTRLELDPYHVYKRFEKAPRKHAVNFDQLAVNCAFVNLGESVSAAPPG